MDRYRVLGKTGMRVFEIGFGGWAIGGSCSDCWGYGPTDDRNSLGAIRAALDHGCNFFDTADSYGHGRSEALLGTALHACRKDVFIATKVGYDFYHAPSQPNFHPAYIRLAAHQSLRRLKTDYIDLYQLHNPPSTAVCHPGVLDVLQQLQEEGKIRHFGVSAATVDDAVTAVRSGWVQTVQIYYNILAPEAETTLFPLAERHGTGIIVREPLANGLLSGKYDIHSRFPVGDIRGLRPVDTMKQTFERVEGVRPYRREEETLAQLAIRFALEPHAVSLVLCGCKTKGQVEENFSAG